MMTKEQVEALLARLKQWQGATPYTECCDLARDCLALYEREAQLRKALESIRIRCEEGDPKFDWRETLAHIARAALKAEEKG